jgi:hypothetical protein
MRATGYVAEDNSGKGNIFPTRQQAYMKSGRDQVASEGLGGFQGKHLPYLKPHEQAIAATYHI